MSQQPLNNLDLTQHFEHVVRVPIEESFPVGSRVFHKDYIYRHPYHKSSVQLIPGRITKITPQHYHIEWAYSAHKTPLGICAKRNIIKANWLNKGILAFWGNNHEPRKCDLVIETHLPREKPEPEPEPEPEKPLEPHLTHAQVVAILDALPGLIPAEQAAIVRNIFEIAVKD